MTHTLLYILHQYHNRGGTEEHTKLLARLLGDRFRVFVAHAERGKIELFSGDELFAIFAMDPWEWPMTPYRSPLTELSLTQLLKVVKPDLVHVQHLFRWPLGLLDQLLLHGVKTVVSFHDYYLLTPDFTMRWVNDPEETLTLEYARSVFKMESGSYLQRRRELLLKGVNRCNALISPSQFLADVLKPYLMKSPVVIPHGIEPFERGKRQEGRCRFGYMGALIPQKGIYTLLSAFEEVKRVRPEAELLVFGEGDFIDRKAFPAAQFKGAFSLEDVPSITASIDVGVIPSEFRETFSLTLSEFWQSGRPVVASDVGALQERIKDGENGVLFQSGDVEALQKALLWFIDTNDWRRWEIPYPKSAEAMKGEYVALYESLLR